MRDLKTLLLPVILFACVTTLLGAAARKGSRLTHSKLS